MLHLKKIFLLFTLLAALILMVAPVVRAQDGGFQLADRIAQKVANGEMLVFRVSYHDVSNEFAPQLRAGVEKAAAELGAKADVQFVGPVGANAEEQVAELESLIEAGVDGLAISSVATDALSPIINRALEQGIPVVTFNTDNPNSNRLAFVGQDLVQSGRIAGDLMAQQLDGAGKVIITTLDAAAQWSIDRETGAREALAAYPDIEVVTTVNTGTEPQGIYSAIENAMLANPDVTGILSLECCSNPVAGEYVQRNNLGDQVKVVGFDFLPTTMQLVKDGFIQATIGQAPERQGYEAVMLLMKAAGGDVVSNVDTGAEVVDSTNILRYTFQLADRIAQKVANGEMLVFRVSYHDVSNEFSPQIRAGVEQAAAELGASADVQYVGPVGANAEEQVAELESLIEAGVDGLAISSVATDALSPIINRALEQGIPVVTFNTDNPSSARLAFVGQDLVQSGRIAGDLMAQQLDGAGKVIITTLDAAAQWSIDRETGAREALAAYPDIEVVTTVNTGTEPQGIYSAIENAMLANPDVTGILSLECCSNPVAGEYVQRNNLGDQVKVVGFDFLPTTMQLVKDGFIQATIGQAPERQGYEAVMLLMKAAGGDVVSNVDTGAEVVDSTNIDQYLP